MFYYLTHVILDIIIIILSSRGKDRYEFNEYTDFLYIMQLCLFIFPMCLLMLCLSMMIIHRSNHCGSKCVCVCRCEFNISFINYCYSVRQVLYSQVYLLSVIYYKFITRCFSYFLANSNLRINHTLIMNLKISSKLY